MRLGWYSQVLPLLGKRVWGAFGVLPSTLIFSAKKIDYLVLCTGGNTVSTPIFSDESTAYFGGAGAKPREKKSSIGYSVRGEIL